MIGDQVGNGKTPGIWTVSHTAWPGDDASMLSTFVVDVITSGGGHDRCGSYGCFRRPRFPTLLGHFNAIATAPWTAPLV
jgi:hypothetical protein